MNLEITESPLFSGSNSSGNSSPSNSTVNYPTENITYTWRDINVTAAEERGKRKWLSRLLRFRNNQRPSRKQILTNGWYDMV